jgi:hypothetical protein
MAVALHYNEICEALRRLVQGAVALTADADGSDLVHVGSNRLFHAGDTVELWDSQGQRESHTVVELIGLTQVRLDREVELSFLVGAGAQLRRVPEALPELKWVAQGTPELMPQPAETRLPCVLVQPREMEQPLTAGTNRAYQQNYRCLVYYLERAVEGEAASVELMASAARLFELLMADPYLGGSAWYAQVVRVEAEPERVRRLRDKGFAVVGVAMEVVVQRVEVG